MSLEDIQGEDEEETAALKELGERAVAYLQRFDWCSTINDIDLVFGIYDIIAFCRVRYTAVNGDRECWVIVGDIPPAHFFLAEAVTIEEVFKLYVLRMREWIAAVESGADVSGCIRVNVPPTTFWANQLASRLNYLERELEFE